LIVVDKMSRVSREDHIEKRYQQRLERERLERVQNLPQINTTSTKNAKQETVGKTGQDTVQISKEAQEAYKKSTSATPSVQIRAVIEGTGAGGSVSSSKTSQTSQQTVSGKKTKEDNNSKDKITGSVIRVIASSAGGAITGAYAQHKDYQNRMKVAEAARKINGPTGAPRVSPPDYVKGAITGAGAAALAGIGTEIAKSVYNHYDNIAKTKGINEAVAKAVENRVIAPFEPYASMPTPEEIRKSKGDSKESIKDRVEKGIKESIEKIKDFFKW
jgi:hypothetical protein